MWEIASCARDSANLAPARTQIPISTTNMSGDRTLDEFDEDVYHVGSWCFIFLTVNTRG